MIPKEIKKDLELIVNRLNVKNPAERAVKSILNALLGAIGVNQELAMDAHTLPFTERLLRAIAKSMAGRS
jgi:hypothetical protein